MNQDNDGLIKWACKTLKLDQDFRSPYTRINSKWIKDLNVRPKTIKLLEENIGSKLFDITLSNIFFEYVSSGKGNRRKNKEMGLHLTNEFLHRKENINQPKENTTYWMAEDMSRRCINKGLISKIYKNPYSSTPKNKKTNKKNTQKKQWDKKIGRNLNRHFSKEDVQMAKMLNVTKKRCSMSLIFREMQIKTTMRCHLTPVRMAINKSTKNKCWRGWGEKETLVQRQWDCKLVQPLWKAVWSFLKKIKIGLSYDPEISLLGIFPKKTKTLIRKDICTPILRSLQHYLQ